MITKQIYAKIGPGTMYGGLAVDLIAANKENLEPWFDVTLSRALRFNIWTYYFL